MVPDPILHLFLLVTQGLKQLMVMGHYCIVRIKKVEARSTRDKVHRGLTLSPTFPL
jgi:hypothetical protein